MTLEELNAKPLPFKVRNRFTGATMTARAKEERDPVESRGTELQPGFKFASGGWLPSSDLVSFYDFVQ